MNIYFGALILQNAGAGVPTTTIVEDGINEYSP